MRPSQKVMIISKYKFKGFVDRNAEKEALRKWIKFKKINML